MTRQEDSSSSTASFDRRSSGSGKVRAIVVLQRGPGGLGRRERRSAFDVHILVTKLTRSVGSRVLGQRALLESVNDIPGVVVLVKGRGVHREVVVGEAASEGGEQVLLGVRGGLDVVREVGGEADVSAGHGA